MTRQHVNPDILLQWPTRLLADPPEVEVPAGYELRAYQPGDVDAWIRIYRLAVPSFAEADLRSWWDRYLSLALPRSIFFAVTNGSAVPVATAGCIHHTRDGMFPFGGQLAWVATAPSHQARGLATALSAAATRRLIEIGYECIVVCTGDDLLPAIKVYLRLGYEPLLYEPGMAERWRDIMSRLAMSDRPRSSPADQSTGNPASQEPSRG